MRRLKATVACQGFTTEQVEAIRRHHVVLSQTEMFSLVLLSVAVSALADLDLSQDFRVCPEVAPVSFSLEEPQIEGSGHFPFPDRSNADATEQDTAAVPGGLNNSFECDDTYDVAFRHLNSTVGSVPIAGARQQVQYKTS